MELPVADVEQTLRDLLGCAVTVRAGGITREKRGLAAVYTDGAGAQVAVLWLDHSLAAYAGGSLATVPAESLGMAIDATVLPENLREKVAEVFSVLAPHVTAGGRVELDKVIVTPPAPAEIQALISKAHDRRWLTIEVSGYGAGAAVMVSARSVPSAA